MLRNVRRTVASERIVARLLAIRLVLVRAANYRLAN